MVKNRYAAAYRKKMSFFGSFDPVCFDGGMQLRERRDEEYQ